MPTVSFFASFIWGSVIILSGYYNGWKKSLLIAVINLLIIYQLGGWGSVMAASALIIIPAMIMSALVDYKRDYYEIRSWGVWGAVACVLLYLGTSYYQMGPGGAENLQKAMQDYIGQVLEMSRNSEMVRIYAQRGISWQYIEDSFQSFGRNLLLHLPALYCLQGVAVAFLALWGASWFAQRKGLPVLSRKDYRDEIMPWQLTWVVILALSLWLWGRDDLSAVYYAGSNLLLFMAPITMYYGLAGFIYRAALMSPRARKWAIIFLVVMSLVFFVSVVIFLALLGLFDALLDYRKIRTRKGEP